MDSLSPEQILAFARATIKRMDSIQRDVDVLNIQVILVMYEAGLSPKVAADIRCKAEEMVEVADGVTASMVEKENAVEH